MNPLSWFMIQLWSGSTKIILFLGLYRLNCMQCTQRCSFPTLCMHGLVVTCGTRSFQLTLIFSLTVHGLNDFYAGMVCDPLQYNMCSQYLLEGCRGSSNISDSSLKIVSNNQLHCIPISCRQFSSASLIFKHFHQKFLYTVSATV